MSVRRLLRLAGALAALVALGWIIVRFARSGAWATFMASDHRTEAAWRLIVAMPLYATGLLLAGTAWWLIQGALISGRTRWRPFVAVYATTQIAKYLPGNIGHLVGRHVLLRRHGVGHRALLWGTAIEAGCLVLSAAAWAAPAASRVWPALSWRPGPIVVGALELSALGIGVAVVATAVRRAPSLARHLPLQHPGLLIAALPLQWGLFGMMALALSLPASALVPGTVTLDVLPPVVAAAWIAGFLVVGAPAGIGVREAVFVALLARRMPESDALLLAAAFRVVSFGGDLLFFLLGLALGGPRPSVDVPGEAQVPA